MSKRSPPSSTSPIDVVSKRARIPQTCSICHRPRAATIVMFNGQPVRRPHEYDCKIYGKCEDPNCGYPKGHPEVRKAKKRREKISKAEAKRQQQQKLAAIAGVEQAQTPHFDAALQDALVQAGIDRNTSPGPACLNVVLKAAQSFTSSQRPLPPSKQCRTRSQMEMRDDAADEEAKQQTDLAAVNAVVQLLETPKRTTSVPRKWQCRVCSWIQHQISSMHENATCECCNLPLVSLAPDTATTNPSVLRHGLSVRDNVEEVLRSTGTHCSSSSHFPSKPAEITTVSATSTPRQRPYPRPDVWPCNKKCIICDSIGVEKYCSCCCNYVCNGRTCMAVLHDEATKAQFGCLPEDIYNITTGRLPFGSSSSSVSSRSINDDVTLERQPTRLTRDLIEIGSSSDSELDLDLFEDDDDDVDQSGDDYDEVGGPTMVDVGTSSSDLIILVDVAVQTDSDEKVESHVVPLQQISSNANQENIHPQTNMLLKDIPSLEKVPSQTITKSTQLSVTQFLRKL